MIAIDTNVLVRLLVMDNEQKEQCYIAKQLASKAKTLFISQTVQVETIWVIKRAYKLEKSEILAILEMLYQNTIFKLENPEVFYQAMNFYRNANADFSDYMILSTAQKNAVALWTFDKKLSKTDTVNLLTQDNLDLYPF